MTITKPVGRHTGAPDELDRPRRRPGPVELFVAVLVVAVLLRGWLVGWTDSERIQTWLTIFVSIVIQATPFVVLGTVVSAAIAALVPTSFFARALPRNPVLAVPVAGVAGAVLPGCECGSVPIAGALVRRGVSPAAALAFLLSAPAINPVVLAATAVAFPRHTVVKASQHVTDWWVPSHMVIARLVASLLASIVMGWLWLRLGRAEWLRPPERPELAGLGRASAFLAACRTDMVQASGYLVIGGLTAATLNVAVPPKWLQAVGGQPVLSVLALAVLAVVLSICSEADAFVAASLTQFSLTARLAFLVVGPMIDAKLFAMQAGTFGRRFAVRFAPTTFVVAILSAVTVGAVLL